MFFVPVPVLWWQSQGCLVLKSVEVYRFVRPYQQQKSFGAATGMSAANKQLSNPFYAEQQKPVAPIS